MFFKLIKFQLLILAISLSIHGLAQTDFDWSNPKYTEVRAYLYGVYDDTNQLIITKEKKIHHSVLNENGILLNENQIQTLIEIVNDTSDYIDSEIMCFMPHYGFVFYDEKNEPIAHISICIGCNKMILSPKYKDFNLEKGLLTISEIFKSFNFPLFNNRESLSRFRKETIDTTQYIFDQDEDKYLTKDSIRINYMKAKKFFKNKTTSEEYSKHQIEYSFIVERNGTISDLKIKALIVFRTDSLKNLILRLNKPLKSTKFRYQSISIYEPK